MARPKKSIRFQVREFKNTSGTLSYRVEGIKSNGERVRKNFTTRLLAEQERVDLEMADAGQPTKAKSKRTRLTDEQLADAEAATIAAGDQNLATIVSNYLGIKNRLLNQNLNIDDAIMYVESHYQEQQVSVSIFDAYNMFLEGKTDREQKTKQFYESTLKKLLLPDPNRPIHKVTVHDIEKILTKYRNLNTRRSHRTAFSVFFNWAARHHYCQENPCIRLDKLPRDMSQIATLNLDETKRLLHAAMLYQNGASAACIAIGLFAGLRPSEIRDLKPDDIFKDKIRITGGKMRRKLKRSSPIPPVLAAWLKKYPFSGIPKGWDSKLKNLKSATKARVWVQDIIRHTSITFQTERDKNEALTAYNCGTSITMMNRHYRDSIDDDKTVVEFWNLTPKKVLAYKLSVKLPNTNKVNWPEKLQLKKLVWEKPLVQVAKGIGVSDVALRKHCVKLGITLPPRGHWLKYS